MIGAQREGQDLAVVGVDGLGDPGIEKPFVRKDLVDDPGQAIVVVLVLHLEDLGRALLDVHHVDVLEVAGQAVKNKQLLLALGVVL